MAQLVEIIVEILTNIVTYSKGNGKIQFVSESDSMNIVVTNDCEDKSERKGGKGIKSLSKIVNKINVKSRIENGLFTICSNGKYQLHIRLDKSLIFKG